MTDPEQQTPEQPSAQQHPSDGGAAARPAADGDAELAGMLASWLPQQRWFAGRTELAGVDIVSRHRLAAEPAAADSAAPDAERAEFEHLIVEVPAADGVRRYQLWIGRRPVLPERLTHAEIGAAASPGGSAVVLYDALHDPELSALLLRAIAENRTLGDVTAVHREGVLLDPSAHGFVVTGEQSNTSIMYGDSGILKVFRRLEPGPNPDAEVHAALAERGSAHSADLFGEMTGPVGGEPTTLAVLTQFFANSADGWQMATASVRDLMAEGDLRADEVGGDFAAESYRLGQAVASVHRDLAEAFGTSPADEAQLRADVEAMATLAASTIDEVPELTPYRDAVLAVFAQATDFARAGNTVPLQRIHGDLHLGQTLRTLTGWAVIDFEGEPSKSLQYRRALHSPLRDVAGMLRSLDYAGHHMLAGTGQPDAQHQFRADEWASRNRKAFCDGYAAEAGTDPRAADALLRAFELDRAVYEAGYEHNYRPSWLPIPLQAVATLTSPGGHHD